MKYLSDRIDRTLPFCVYITVYRGNKLPPFYIGHTSVKRIEEGYRGSVSSKRYKHIWKSELEKSPELFKTFIITTHSHRKDASNKEVSFQRLLQVVDNSLYINLSIHDNGYRHYPTRKGCTLTEDHKNKISKALRGKKKSDIHKNKIREIVSKRGPVSKETRMKMGEARRGKKHSENTKKILSNMKKGRVLSNEEKIKLCEKRNKHTWKIIDNHTGNFYEIINLRMWCIENFGKLSHSAQSSLSKIGKYKHYTLVYK